MSCHSDALKPCQATVSCLVFSSFPLALTLYSHLWWFPISARSKLHKKRALLLVISAKMCHTGSITAWLKVLKYFLQCYGDAWWDSWGYKKAFVCCEAADYWSKVFPFYTLSAESPHHWLMLIFFTAAVLILTLPRADFLTCLRLKLS